MCQSIYTNQIRKPIRLDLGEKFDHIRVVKFRNSKHTGRITKNILCR